jgi:hypothetical protein
LQVVSVLQKVAESRLTAGDLDGGSTLNDAITSVAGRGHVKLVPAAGSFHLNTAILDASLLSLEPGALMPQFGDFSEQINFQKSIHPVLSERMLEPQELVLLESVYLSNKVEVAHSFGNEAQSESFEADLQSQANLRATQTRLQYAGGCLQSTSSSVSSLTSDLLQLGSNLKMAVNSHLKTMDTTLKDYLTLILNDRTLQHTKNSDQKVLDYDQLCKARRFLSDQIESY